MAPPFGFDMSLLLGLTWEQESFPEDLCTNPHPRNPGFLDSDALFVVLVFDRRTGDMTIEMAKPFVCSTTDSGSPAPEALRGWLRSFANPGYSRYTRSIVEDRYPVLAWARAPEGSSLPEPDLSRTS